MVRSSIFSIVLLGTLLPSVIFAAPPAAPTLDSEKTDGFNVTGTGTPGSTVLLATEDGAQCVNNVDGDPPVVTASGTFQCRFNQTPTDGSAIVGVAINADGEESARGQVGTINTVPDTNTQFFREGVFGCSAGQYALPTGTLAAIGGVYVPVNDAAVTLNTGYLVYKECVLDGVTTRMREAASAAIVRTVLNYINTGDQGNPLYPGTLQEYVLEHQDDAALEFLKNYNIQNVCAPYQKQVRAALAREYMAQTRNANDAFACSVDLSDQELAATLQGSFPGWGNFLNMAVNQEHPLGAYQRASLRLGEELNQTQRERETYLQWSQGLLPAEEVVSEPTDTDEEALSRRILTPGFVISRTLEQVSGSGFRQLESASEIDQIVNALFSGISNRIVTDVRGLKGLSENQGGEAAYLERLSAEASAGVRQGAANAALSILNSSLSVEKSFRTLKTQMLTRLDRAESDLEKAEAQCWSLLIPKVRAYANENGNCIRTEQQIDPETGQSTSVCVERQAAPLAITLQRIATGSTVELKTGASPGLAQGAQTQVHPQSLPAKVAKADVGLRMTAGVAFVPNATLRLAISGAPITNNKATAAIGASSPVTNGSLDFETTPDAYIAGGAVSITLTPAAPFVSGKISLTLTPVYPRAQSVIADNITPLRTIVENDLNDSDDSLLQLQRLVNDVRNTSAQSAQRLALEKLDSLVASGSLHTAFDVKAAQEQKNNLDGTMDSLVRDTITEWGSDGGWCNAANEDVVKQWFERWKVTN